MRWSGRVSHPRGRPPEAEWSHQAGWVSHSSGGFRRDANGAAVKPCRVPHGEGRPGTTRMQVSNVTEA